MSPSTPFFNIYFFVGCLGIAVDVVLYYVKSKIWDDRKSWQGTLGLIAFVLHPSMTAENIY